MAKLLYTILVICVVVQLMFALCDARDLASDLDNMMDKTKESMSNAGDAIKEMSKDFADKVEETVKSI